MLEIGSYCGKSSIYLGTAARERDTVLFALDHHRGSEENQPGWEWHEPDLVDPEIGVMDTLPSFRRTIHGAGLEQNVVALVGDSPTVGRHWRTPLALLFIDGGHGPEPAHRDYEIWTPWVESGGLLAIHDVFPDPADGGRPPYEIYCRALEAGEFTDVRAQGSLRVLRRRPTPRAGAT
jgi:predicted O-methyltransferase YrrM